MAFESARSVKITFPQRPKCALYPWLSCHVTRIYETMFLFSVVGQTMVKYIYISDVIYLLSWNFRSTCMHIQAMKYESASVKWNFIAFFLTKSDLIFYNISELWKLFLWFVTNRYEKKLVDIRFLLHASVDK